MTDPIRGARLAERLAALSLGIDLGFGQPMKHVLRQCRIALRMCELAGAGDDARAAASCSALLVNVGCHTDADEQAQWFGDDIALKALKYAQAASKLSEMAAENHAPPLAQNQLSRPAPENQSPLHTVDRGLVAPVIEDRWAQRVPHLANDHPQGQRPQPLASGLTATATAKPLTSAISDNV